MSISGLFMVLFLLFHVSMNMVALFSGEAFNLLAGYLGANWYALIGTMVLAGGFLVHIVYAFVLTWQNRKARGDQRYAVNSQPGVSWPARNMLVLGIIVVLGLILHMMHFWARMQLAEILGQEVNGLGYSPHDGYSLLVHIFSNPFHCLVYLVWFAALWMHLTHGFWSALQTVGASNSVWLPRIKVISTVFATLICLGFASVVIVFYLRSLGCLGAC